MNIFKLSKVWVYVFLLVVGFLTFGNGLRNEFCIDDHAFFDEKMGNIKYLPYQFLPDKNAVLKIRDQQTDAYYRPMAHVIPMLVYLQFGNNVVGHHAVNIVLFSTAAFMLYVFLMRLFANPFLALTAAVFYLVHPINGVAVNYITANVFSAQIIFMVLALLSLLRLSSPLLLSPRKRGSSTNSVGFWIPAFAGMTMLIFFLLALMCHETAMALPFYAFALMFVLNKEEGVRPAFIKALKQTLPLWIFLVVYFIWRLKFASLGSSVLGNYAK